MQRSIASFFQPMKGGNNNVDPRKQPGETALDPGRASRRVRGRVAAEDKEEEEEAKGGENSGEEERATTEIEDEGESGEEEEKGGEESDGQDSSGSHPESPRTVSGCGPPPVGQRRGGCTPGTTGGPPTDPDPPRRRTARKQLPRRSEGKMNRRGETRGENESPAKRRRTEGKEQDGRKETVKVEEVKKEEKMDERKVEEEKMEVKKEEKKVEEEKMEVKKEEKKVEEEEMEVKKKEEEEEEEEEEGEGEGGEQEDRPRSEREADERTEEQRTKAEGRRDGEKVETKSKSTISSFFAPRKPVSKPEKEPKGGKGVKEVSPPNPNTGGATSVFGVQLNPDSRRYDPSKPRYDPETNASWRRGESVPYLAVAVTFEKIEAETSRMKIVETLSNFFRSVLVLTTDDLLPCLYLSLNRLGPAHEGLELGVGDGLLVRAVAQATGRQVDRVRREVQDRGDLGLVAESSRSTQRRVFNPPPLTARGVYGRLTDIAGLTGGSSMTKKMEVIKGLLVACRQSEARYLIRALGGKLRIGLAEQSVLSALAQAVCLTREGTEGMSSEKRKAWIDEQTHILKQTYCEMPDYNVIVPLILEKGIDRLPQYCGLTPGTPLKPMLAHPTRGVGEVMRRFTGATFVCEYKYDGERAQIHLLESGEVHVYSRNQENNTTKYPDIITRIGKVRKDHVRSCVIDTEAVAWDREKGKIQPFQVLTTRKRKDVDPADITVQVCVYAFDLLYLNGQSLVKEPFSKRRQLLWESFTEIAGEFVFAESMVGSNTEEIAEFLEQSIRDSCEGLMVKTLDVNATYEIAKRSHNWLKLKKDYLDGVGDSLDLVVIGGYRGRGKRVGVYGGFLLACYHPQLEEFHTVCKIGTGFKDEDLEQHAEFFKAHLLDSPRPYYRCDVSAEPDLWFDAVQVWEVKCADLSISPLYKAAIGMVGEGKGISLRFPRFLRVRGDKKPEEATTSEQIADLYQKQQQIQNQQTPTSRDGGNEDSD